MSNIFPPVASSSNLRKFIRKTFFERTWKTIDSTKKILDFCCGHGLYLEVNPHAFGVEGDSQVVNYLQARGYMVKQANVLNGVPYENQEFDIVLSHDVFEHFEFSELKVVMSEIWRILKSGGYLYVWVPNRKGFDFAIDEGHKHFVTEVDIKFLSGEYGFEITDHYPEPFPRFVGKYFPHNKEVFILRKLSNT